MRRHSHAQRGMGVVEYLGIVAVVGALVLSLVALRAHVVGRKAPVRAVPPILKLLEEQRRAIEPPPPRVVTRRVTTPRRAPRRRSAPRVSVDVPAWLVR